MRVQGNAIKGDNKIVGANKIRVTTKRAENY